MVALSVLFCDVAWPERLEAGRVASESCQGDS